MRVDFTEQEQLMAKLSDISVIGVFWEKVNEQINLLMA